MILEKLPFTEQTKPEDDFLDEEENVRDEDHRYYAKMEAYEEMCELRDEGPYVDDDDDDEEE